MLRSETAPTLGSASPRNPKVRILSRSSSEFSLLVACRSMQTERSAGGMPFPLSRTSIRAFPPSSRKTPISVAPASIEFSTSSLTTLAGRSITSPAAIRSATAGLRTRMTPGCGLPVWECNEIWDIVGGTPPCVSSEGKRGGRQINLLEQPGFYRSFWPRKAPYRLLSGAFARIRYPPGSRRRPGLW